MSKCSTRMVVWVKTVSCVQQNISPTGIGEEEGVLRQRDDTHQDPVEVRPVKKRSDSVNLSFISHSLII